MKKRVLTLFLALALILTIFPATVFANNTINVYLTVNNKGVIATGTDGANTLMTNKEITVTDLNDDGEFTVDEVLKAAHALYCVDGYETAKSSYGTSVTKLWGVSTYNTLFFVNGVGLTTDVGTDTVVAGDKVYVSVNADDTNYADWYTSFNVPEKTVTSGQEFTLTLTGFQGMSGGTVKPVSGVSIGLLGEGLSGNTSEFQSIADKKTDASGNVTLKLYLPSYDTAKVYYITAQGTVKDMVGWTDPKTEADCPIMVPVCKVTVNPNVTEGNPTFEIKNKVNNVDAYYDIPETGNSYLLGDSTSKLGIVQISGTKAAPKAKKAYKWYKYESALGTDSGSYGGTNQTVQPSSESTGALWIEGTVIATPTGGLQTTYTTNRVLLTVDVNQSFVDSKKPVFSTQLQGGTWKYENEDAILTANASKGNGYSFDWQVSTDNGSTWSSYKNTADDQISLESLPVGTYKFKCIDTYKVNDKDGHEFTTSTESNVADVIIYALADSWKGSGTQADPYLITNSADLVSLEMRCADNESFKGKYFKMTSDITLPADWTPVGTEDSFFSGNIDGNGHTLTIPENGRPLLGYVRNSSVQNLSIFAPKAASTALVERYVVDNESEKTINITNCTIKSGSKTLLSGFIGGYASGTNVVTMRNCTVEKGVVIGYDGTKEHIGSFGGEFNGYIYNCVSYATVKGTNFVGGILANKGQTMGPCTVDGCKFYGSVQATGKYAGGICGSGYAGTSWGLTTAGNTPMTTIDNCAVYGTVKGSNFIGGILGAEACLVQCWENGVGSISNNMFFGKISATDNNATVGAIIGFMGSLNKYTTVKNNTYVSGCGVNKGIGDVRVVDTNCSTIDKSANPNTFYMDSSISTVVPTTFHMTDYDFPQGSGTTQGYSIRSDHNRTDDPLGKDAEVLAREISTPNVIEVNSEKGNTGTWIVGSKLPLVIHIDAPYNSFLELVLDGNVVSKKYYTVEDGSIIVKILPEYLQTLTTGKHSIVVKTLFGDANVDIEIVESTEKVANTADTNNIAILVVTTLGSAICAALVVSTKKKKEN